MYFWTDGFHSFAGVVGDWDVSHLGRLPDGKFAKRYSCRGGDVALAGCVVLCSCGFGGCLMFMDLFSNGERAGLAPARGSLIGGLGLEAYGIGLTGVMKLYMR